MDLHNDGFTDPMLFDPYDTELYGFTDQIPNLPAPDNRALTDVKLKA